MPTTVCAQVLGALCLAGHEYVAAELINGLIAHSTEDLERSTADPRTRLQQVLGRTALDIEVERTGPDHASSFRATLTDSRGRRSIGEGQSKKHAIRLASADFLNRYVPGVSAEEKVRLRAEQKHDPLPVAGRAFEGHVRAAQYVREVFNLSSDADALLSQALIHSSWTYEHQQIVAGTHQQNNQVLGLIGSHVLMYEYALRVVSVILKNPPNEFSLLTMERESYERGFYHLGLGSGLLMGVGQASIGVNIEMASNAFQAVIAAIFVARDYPDSLLNDWPQRLSRLRDIVVPDTPRPQDSATLLQEICAVSQLTSDYSFELSGPTHHQRARGTLIIGSPAIGRRITITGGSVPGGKRPAKQEVATTVLEILDALAEAESTVKLAGSNGKDVHVAVLLLAHLASVAPNAETMARRWIGMGLFGTHLAKTPKALSEWAHGADQLLERQNLIAPDVDAMTKLFRAAIAISTDQANPGRALLTRALQWLESAESPEHIEEWYLSQLVQLCDLYRALGSDEPDVDLPRLVDDWQMLYGSRVRARTRVPMVVLNGSQRGAADALMSLLLREVNDVVIEVEEGTPLHVRIITEGDMSTKEIAAACALWTASNPMLELASIDNGVDMALAVFDTRREAGPVGRAVAAAVRPVPTPYGSAVADLLHDLKNQLIAAKGALATAAPAAQASSRGPLRQAATLIKRSRSAAALALLLHC